MNKKQASFALVFSFSLFWGLSIFFNKIGLIRNIDPLVMGFQVFFFAGLMLLSYSLALYHDEYRKIKKDHLLLIMLSGFIGTGLGNIFSFFGLDLTASANYGFVIKTGTIFSIVLAYFFLGERLSRQKIVLAFVMLAGAYLISTGGNALMPHKGDILIMVAALCYTIANIIVKKLDKKVNPDVISGLRAPFAAVILFLAVIIMDKDFLMIKEPIVVGAASAFTALFVIFLNRGIHATSISYMTMMSMLTPVIVAFLGIAFLGESMNTFHVMGAVIIIISGILISRTDIHNDGDNDKP